MTCAEVGQRRLVCKERGQAVLRAAQLCGAVGEALDQRVIVGRRTVRRIHCRTERDRIKRVFGQDTGLFIEVQRLTEAPDKPFAIVQRAAEKHDLARDAPPLRKPRDGLVDHRLIDAGGHVRLGRALIQERLHVGLGKHAAARRDRVDLRGLKARRVHLVHAHVEQHRHLVDESARAARAAAVHALIHAAGKEDDLCILAAELDDRARIRGKLLDKLARRVDLLHEGQPRRLGKSQPRRAGNGDGKRCLAQQLRRLRKHLQRLLPHLRKMPLIARIQQAIPLGEDDLDRRRTDVDAERAVRRFRLFSEPVRHASTPAFRQSAVRGANCSILIL